MVFYKVTLTAVQGVGWHENKLGAFDMSAGKR